ncbi:MAG: peptidase M14, partial [Bacteroidota bacterium]
WTLPLTYGLTYGRMQQSIDRVAGEMLPPIELDGGALVGGQARYAYIMPWGRYYAPRALYRLQAAGLQVRLMRGPLTASVDGEPQAFEAGSIVIPVVQPEVSSETVHELVASIPAMDHVMMYAIDTGLSLQGIDLGSPQGDVLELPSVGLVVGAGTNSNSAGEAWHLFNERMAMPVTLLDTRNLGRADLSRYNTLIMTGGSYGSVPAEAVRDWVRSGGRLIATTSAADWAIRNDMVDLTVKDADLDSLFEDLPYDQLDEAYGAQRIGGSIFEATLDVTHPLAYGYDDTLPVFRRGTTFYEPSDRPGTNVATYAADPLLSGYISEEMLEMAGGSASVVAQRVGRGAVILMMDNPNFRAFWYGTNGLFLNAVFFGGSF